MAGHFLIWRMPQSVLDTYLTLGCHILPPANQPPAHQAGVANGNGGVFQGWNANSSNELSRARDGHAIGNRDNLPPHRYLELPAGQPSLALAAQLLTDKEKWIAQLERPSTMGLPALSVTVVPVYGTSPRSIWGSAASDYRFHALVAQMHTGPVSIEYYYVGNNRVS